MISSSADVEGFHSIDDVEKYGSSVYIVCGRTSIFSSRVYRRRDIVVIGSVGVGIVTSSVVRLEDVGKVAS